MLCPSCGTKMKELMNPATASSMFKNDPTDACPKCKKHWRIIRMR